MSEKLKPYQATICEINLGDSGYITMTIPGKSSSAIFRSRKTSDSSFGMHCLWASNVTLSPEDIIKRYKEYEIKQLGAIRFLPGVTGGATLMADLMVNEERRKSLEELDRYLSGV